MALVNDYTDMKKFLKNLLLRNCRSDFDTISQESVFDTSCCPDCPIWAAIPKGELLSPFMSQSGK